MTKRLIIGLVGNPASGKSGLARYLAEKHGFFHFEGSDYLRSVAKKRGTRLKTREDYSNLHRELQQLFGPTVMADYLLARPETKLVFAGLRSTQNTKKLQAAGGIVIALEASVEIRFRRAKSGELKNETTLSDFKKAEEAQYISQDHLGADLLSTMKLADKKLDTSKPIDQTLQEIDEIVDRFPLKR